MKLVDVKTRTDVRAPGSSDEVQYFSALKGWDLSFEQGLVTIRAKDGAARIVPVANVAYMTPERPAEAKKDRAA